MAISRTRLDQRHDRSHSVYTVPAFRAGDREYGCIWKVSVCEWSVALGQLRVGLKGGCLLLLCSHSDFSIKDCSIRRAVTAWGREWTCYVPTLPEAYKFSASLFS